MATRHSSGISVVALARIIRQARPSSVAESRAVARRVIWLDRHPEEVARLKDALVNPPQ